ncbi:phosphocarrier protein [Elusimicrobium posterum]|uniref:HPr family phosphocarrier protein n=1 Tax=Elusimicrobium posterum TaxID=3116653 RepID=UPI003C71C8C4
MIEKDIKVENQMGIHARPAAMLAQTAGKFKADIKMAKRGIEINVKSIMGIMMLAAEHGTVLHFTFEGEDEQEAAKAIEEIFTNRFGEEI